MISFILKVKDYYVGFEIVVKSISGIVGIVRSAKSDKSAARLSWKICILAFPAFGICLYLMFGRSGLTKKARKKYDSINQKFTTELAQKPEVITSLKEKNIYIHNQEAYIDKISDFPVYQNTEVAYFPQTDKAVESMLNDLKNAKEFIFMEYVAGEDSEDV